MSMIKFLLILFLATGLNVNAAQIKKSSNDKREYKSLTLENGMKVLLVSDQKAQRAAAAVDVYAGSGDEPDAFPGLAHFLEHMLFLGTDQYPSPDDYINYVSDHGGSHNAFTAFAHTNYFFDIDPAYLHEGLKRFSRFFVAPLLSDKYVERERNAVDSEYQSKLREDGWRGMEVFKQVINQAHPYARFNIGNNETLPNETVKAALLEFYQRYYSADRMSVIILGKEPLQVLETWAVDLFSAVPKRAQVNNRIAEKLFSGVTLPVEVRNQTIKNHKKMNLYFSLPYLIDNEYSKSLDYISYVLGYEGEGSLLAGLKAAGLATGLYSGAGHKIGEEVSFDIGVTLTEKGYKDSSHVLAMIFAYLEVLKADSDGAARYAEIAKISETDFKFKGKVDAIHEVSSLATKLNRYKATDVLAIGSLFSGYNQQQINDYLALMSVDKVLVQLSSPKVEADKYSPYFNVPYSVNTLDKKDISRHSEVLRKVNKASLFLPKPNAFIATQFALYDAKGVEARSALDNGVELFYKNNVDFGVPKVNMQVSLQPTFALTIKDKTTLSLFAQLLEEELTHPLYDASIAGLEGDVAAGEKSLLISIDGYQDKIQHLFSLILTKVKAVDFDANLFIRVKTEFLQTLENQQAKMPYQQTFPYLNDALLKDSSLPKQQLEALKSIELADVKALQKKLLQSLAVRLMVYGNVLEADAVSLAEEVARVLDTTNFKHKWQMNKAVALKEPASKAFSVNHQDNAITLYLQAGKGFKERAYVGLLGKLLEPSFFTKLRTEKQLGYIVFAYPRPFYAQAGIAFTIQSPVASADALEGYIKGFYTDFAQQISKLSQAEFDSAKEILKGELLQTPENISASALKYWSDIVSTNDVVPSTNLIANALEQITKADFIAFYHNLLAAGLTYSVKASGTSEK